MKVEQYQYSISKGWKPHEPRPNSETQLLLIFGESQLLNASNILKFLHLKFKNARLLGCSTSGEIFSDRVFDDTIVVSALTFESTTLSLGSIHLKNIDSSYNAGKLLAQTIPHKNLKHVLTLSVGLNINGSDLTKGLRESLPPGVSVTGGLAGDKEKFQQTYVIANQTLSNDLVAVLGFYGDQIQIGAASMGGWDTFGPEKLITKSKGNVLYELDGHSALEVYKKYLGEHAKDLPGSALRFPLSIRLNDSNEKVVRTILSVDESAQSMTFAGDLPENSYAQLMKANFDRVIDGAIGAAQGSVFKNKAPDFALLISCVGRKIILKQRIDEEVEGVRTVFGSPTFMTGFYSYGEICPFKTNSRCELHNQTMTVTTISELKRNAS